MKRGAIASPQHVLSAAEPHVPSAVIPPNHIFLPAKLSVWHNDVYGDCVTAEEAFAKACHDPEVFITDQTVLNWATANGVLNGASIWGVLNAMRYGGFYQYGGKYNDGKFYSVDWTNPGILQSALAYGPVKLGVAANQLEPTCQATGFQSGWFATGYRLDTREDHCPSLCGYGTIAWLFEQLNIWLAAQSEPQRTMPAAAGDGSQPGYAMFTWGGIGVIDVPSLLAITWEAWLRTPTTIIK